MTAHPELPGIPKKVGRPKTSPLSREEQQAAASAKWREEKEKAFVRKSVFIDRARDVELQAYADATGQSYGDALNKILTEYLRKHPVSVDLRKTRKDLRRR